jgi:hypothetical protein
MTARTLDDVVREARYILQDTDTNNYRYPQSRLIDAYNIALAEAWRLRPDLFITQYAAGVPTVSNTVTPLTSVAFPIDEMVFALFCDYVAGRAELADDEFSVDGRAFGLIANFKQALAGGG